MSLWTIDEIREEILKLTRSASYRPAGFYRAFTTRIKELLGDLKVLKGDDSVVEVTLMYANPERAVAKIVDGRNVTLPLMSLQFDGIEIDTGRRKPLENLVERKYWDRDKQRAVRLMALAPVASTLRYVVNVWGKYIEEVNQLTEQLILKFRPNLPVDIHPEEVYQAFIVDVGEATNLTAHDREDRVVRRTVRFQIEAYVPGDVFRFTNTGEIEAMKFEVYTELVEDGTLIPLESFDMTHGDGYPTDIALEDRRTTYTSTGPSPTTGTTSSTTTGPSPTTTSTTTTSTTTTTTTITLTTASTTTTTT